MSSPTRKAGYEPWSFAAFGLAALAFGFIVYLGTRPGGAAPVWIHGQGLPIVGLAAALLLAFGIGWSLWKRPALQRGRVHSLFVLAGVLLAGSFPFAYPSSHAGHPSRVAFRPPFEGSWIVRQAGDDKRQNLLVLRAATRFGLVFAPSADDVALQSRRIVAPAAGEVTAVSSDELVLKVAEDEFMVLRGFDSAPTPAFGSIVARGQILGIGAALGVSISLRDGAGEGIPLRFDAIRVDGKPIESGRFILAHDLRPGQRVESAATSDSASR